MNKIDLKTVILGVAILFLGLNILYGILNIQEYILSGNTMNLVVGILDFAVSGWLINKLISKWIPQYKQYRKMKGYYDF